MSDPACLWIRLRRSLASLEARRAGLKRTARYIECDMTDSKQTQATAIVIMAAGKGTRLKSKHPKVLHEVGGKPLLAYVIAAAKKVVPANDVYVVVGHEAENVRSA